LKLELITNEYEKRIEMYISKINDKAQNICKLIYLLGILIQVQNVYMYFVFLRLSLALNKKTEPPNKWHYQEK